MIATATDCGSSRHRPPLTAHLTLPLFVMALILGRASQMYSKCCCDDAAVEGASGSSAATSASSCSDRLLNMPDMGCAARESVTLLYIHTMAGTAYDNNNNSNNNHNSNNKSTKQCQRHAPISVSSRQCSRRKTLHDRHDRTKTYICPSIGTVPPAEHRRQLSPKAYTAPRDTTDTLSNPSSPW